MKTSTIAILLAAAALNTANALKCHKNGTGVLASWEDTILVDHLAWTQYYRMKDGKLAKSKLPGEEYDFYVCEAPEKFVNGGVLKTKDGKKCLTNSFIRVRDPSQDIPYHTGYKQVPEKAEKKVTLEDCAEGGMELRKQWFTIMAPMRKGCSGILQLQGHKSDDILELTYGPKGVAFDEPDGLGPKKTEDGHQLDSTSFFMTGRLDATCVDMSP